MSEASKDTEREARSAELLERVGMTQWSKRRLRTYSKGMRQRIGLAQALINDPELVFLDEPTDGVDPGGRKEIRDLMIRMRDEGRTVFVNSHVGHKGGSVSLSGGSNPWNVEFLGCSVEGSTAGLGDFKDDPQGEGGAFSVGEGVTLLLADCTLKGNSCGKKVCACLSCALI